MPLAPDELAAFVADGVITKRGFVAAELVGRAAALVTDWYHTDMDQSRLVDYTQRTFAPEFGDHEDLLALFTRSGAADLVHELVGNFSPITTTRAPGGVSGGRVGRIVEDVGQERPGARGGVVVVEVAGVLGEDGQQ